mgnify:CR=1 FL=1
MVVALGFLIVGTLLLVKSISTSCKEYNLNISKSVSEQDLDKHETYQHIQTTGTLFFSVLFMGIGFWGVVLIGLL